MARDSITLQCPAKVNLALSVGKPLEPGGLHLICSWMVAVDFYDRLTLTRVTDGHSSFEISWAEDAPAPQEVDWPLTSDLAYRAHGLMQEHVGRELPVHINLEKKIPTGAGLGGGSSDAAGMLKGLNDLFSLGIEDHDLIQLGLRLGSDVGFAIWSILGKGSAIVSDVGDQIEASPSGGNMIPLVLILPPVNCATAEVYQNFDQITQSPVTDEARVRSLANTWPIANDSLFNDLTEAAMAVQPSLGQIRDRVQGEAGLPVHLSGSGAAMFIVVSGADEGAALSQAIAEKTGMHAFCVSSTPEIARQ